MPRTPHLKQLSLAIPEPLCSLPSAHPLACPSSSACSIQLGAAQADCPVGCGLRLGKRLTINASPSLLQEEIEHSSRNKALIGAPLFQLSTEID